MATPLDVEPKRRKLAWIIFVLTMLVYAAYAVYVIYARVVERRSPPVSVEFQKYLSYLRLPAFLVFYFPMNQRLAPQPPPFLVAPNSASPRAPSTLNLTCVADTSRVGQRLGPRRFAPLPPADVSEAAPPTATGTVRMLTLNPAFFNCRAVLGGSYEACKAAHNATLVVEEIPYSVRGNCNVTVGQGPDIQDLRGHWNRLGGSSAEYVVADEVPGPVMFSFDTHNLYLNMSAEDSDRQTPFLKLGIHGLFFTSTSTSNESESGEYMSLERGATYVTHYPKGVSGLEPSFPIPQPDISSWMSLNNNTLYNFDQFTIDQFSLCSKYIFNNETRGIFNAVGPTLSSGFLDDGGIEERVITADQKRQMYQLPGPVSGVTVLPSQFVQLDRRRVSLSENDAVDEETRWISNPTGFRPVSREYIAGTLNPYRTTHPVNLGLYNDARGVQISRQIDPISLTVIYTILFTGLSTVMAVFSCIFITKPEYNELILWEPLARYVDNGCRKKASRLESESQLALTESGVK
eukprot:TRINITY_DN20124_c0_g1_i1.p1 TRINITY_DN20124_c0_g1~~TRINITY_DN20124_c0_g1_i1.p1  ORF type:complete len:519 (+),score=51.51 TRINITY_DN20124_c0_g1_i1:212-1768(+)